MDAAFGRYAREATDFAGGRQLSDPEQVDAGAALGRELVRDRASSEPASPLSSSGAVLAGAADDDPVGLDGHRDRPVAGPVLGVDGVLLDRGVEPEPVALLAVVEGALERLRAAPAAAAAAAPAAAARAVA